MNKLFRRTLNTGVAAIAALSLTTVARAVQQPAASQSAGRTPVVANPDRHDRSPALRDLPVIPPQQEQREPHPPLRFRPDRPQAGAANDPAAQTVLGTGAPSALTSFEGIGNIDSVAPPDTNGDIGPNHYIQWVNLSFAVYDRAGNTLYGPADGRTIWQGFGGACETRNDGDPIVLYDHLADRWLLSQFALPNYPRGPYYQCIAVSSSSNPLGAYYRYQFSFSKLNDYPKFGVWPDGYYMSINQFSYGGFPIARFSWAGQGVAAFDRASMLSGQTAAMVYYDLFAVDPNLGGMLPSELDGPAPPAGSPNYFVQVDDNSWGYSPDQLQIWKFAANWATPGASTFTKFKTLPTAAFDSNMCGYGRACIPQPSTSAKLDAISDRLMYRLQYRNMGSYEALVVNHTVDVNGGDLAGVRWYEVRNPGSAGASIYQQGTFTPLDGVHRWMGSAAMDTNGNIAVGYNISSSSTRPSIRFTGRCAADPLGTMTQGEGDLVLGTGSQTSTHNRWGDYSMLAVDPLDGRTFWFTTEYYQANGSSWRTRIGSFRLDACDSTSAPPLAPSNLQATATSSSQIALSWQDESSDETGFALERCTGANCTDFAQVVQLAANTTSYGDTGLSPNTSYSYRVRASNGAGNSDYSNVASATTNAAPPPGSSHIGDLDGATAGQGNWSATVSIVVHDGSHAPVANAAVSGSWSNGATGSASCTTDGAGRCSVTKGGIKKAQTSVNFTVSGVTAAGFTYGASGNHDPDADSDGTTITVRR